MFLKLDSTMCQNIRNAFSCMTITINRLRRIGSVLNLLHNRISDRGPVMVYVQNVFAPLSPRLSGANVYTRCSDKSSFSDNTTGVPYQTGCTLHQTDIHFGREILKEVHLRIVVVLPKFSYTSSHIISSSIGIRP